MKERVRIPRVEFKRMVAKIVDDCELIAQNYVKNWKPFNKDWETIEGAAYLRLSTDDQVAVEKGSLEQQIYIAISESEIRSKAQKTNLRITKFFIEPGITGKHDKRPKFLALRRDIGKGKIDFVIFKEIARIARETQIWKKFFRLCQEKEVDICIRGFPFNPNDPTQTFQLDIMAAFAEYESNQTSKRIKENNFSAMMSSGKFNSTHSILGFDQLVVSGKAKVGLYTVNDSEIKTVKWIMDRFCILRSQSAVLEELRQKRILNRGEKEFNSRTLKYLLTSKRYIGRWEVNKKNKEKKQDKLMAYDRYEEIDLPYDPPIDIDLWNKVQRIVSEVAGNKTKDKSSTRIYPLTPILYFEDGSKFQGSAGWSSTRKKHFYYYNKKHGLRLPVDLVEQATLKLLRDVIDNSEKLQNALLRRREVENSTLEFQKLHLKGLESKVEGIADEKKKLNRRLDFLLDEEDGEALKSFKIEYRNNLDKLNDDEDKILVEISTTKNKIELILDLAPDRAEMVRACLSAEDFASKGSLKELRGILVSLFSRIVVSRPDSEGVRNVSFVLNNKTSCMSDMEEVFVGHWGKMVGVDGIEPPTSTL